MTKEMQEYKKHLEGQMGVELTDKGFLLEAFQAKIDEYDRRITKSIEDGNFKAVNELEITRQAWRASKHYAEQLI